MCYVLNYQRSIQSWTVDKNDVNDADHDVDDEETNKNDADEDDDDGINHEDDNENNEDIDMGVPLPQRDLL